MKEKISNIIKDFISHYSQKNNLENSFRDAVIKFADADDPVFKELKTVVGKEHVLPHDLLDDAKTVIAYFVPLSKEIVDSNIDGRMSSKSWAQAYLDLNGLINALDKHIKDELEKLNYKTVTIPTRTDFDKESLKNYWSHRHAAYAAGLGKFGLNNMLITEMGCCGRFASLITNLKVEASQRKNKEYCLYKAGEDCLKCVENCVNGALKVDDFDGHKCYEMLILNDIYHSDLLKSTEVCGKCCVGLPCSLTDPVK